MQAKFKFSFAVAVSTWRQASTGHDMQCVVIPVTHYQQNCALIWSERPAAERVGAVIDPGGDLEQVLAAVAKYRVQVTQVLLTHGHCDHAGLAREFADHLGIPLVGPHRDDRFWLDAMPEQAAMMGFGTRQRFLPDHWLEEGERITIGEETLEVLHCPGHTPGHVVFFHRASGQVWVGDVLFAGSIGRTDFPRGDHATLVTAIRAKLWPLGDQVRFHPGHGPSSTIGQERRNNPFVADHRFG